jgi:hypothetical protein
MCPERTKGVWWPGRELNPRHADFQSAALPTELPGLMQPRIKQARNTNVNYRLKINALRTEFDLAQPAK